VLREWAAGHLATLVAAATGTGKSELGFGVLQAEHEAGRLERCLWLAHRTELVDQPVERIERSWPDLAPAGIVQASRDDSDARIIAATVQTLANPARLARIFAHGRISHVIWDEVHHLPARTNLDLAKRLRAHNPDLRLLGITATPKRTDGDGLSRVFKSVAYRISIRDAIRAGALCPFVAVAVQLPVSFAGVPETGENGWEDESAGRVLSADNAETVIVETWKKHAESRPTIAFTASVAQAYSLAEAFRRAGVAAEAADGETDRDDRRGILQRFREGRTRIIANAQLWTEGLDLPMASCILQIKPTKSDLVYVQMAGRGLRLYPGKTELLLMDMVPEDARDLRMAGDLLGKPRKQRKAEERAKAAGVVLDSFGIRSDGSGIDADPDAVQLAVLDYLSNHRLAWTFDGKLASASAGERHILAVRLPDAERVAKADALRASGRWEPRWERTYQEVRSFRVYVVEEHEGALLGLAPTWEQASEVAEEWADEHADGVLAQRKRGWRREPATDKQRRLLARWGIWRDGMTKGQAAQVTTHHIAQMVLR
jgi:superfamily II DNA or RNA helicase